MNENEIHQMLGKILANQESMNNRLLEHFKDDKFQFSDVRKRISYVETKMNRAGGAAAVLITLATIFLGGFWK